jgi:RNA polymerase sigma factor (TIGR02999 family)
MKFEFELELTERLLAEAKAGDDLARERLIALLLRSVQERVLATKWTAPLPALESSIISESLIKLFRGILVDQAPNASWLLGAVNRATREIVVEQWRAKYCQKRKRGSYCRDPHNYLFRQHDEANQGLIELHEALDLLEKYNPKLATIVTLRFFGNMTVAETAQETELSASTVEKYWRLARAWLLKRLSNQLGANSLSAS